MKIWSRVDFHFSDIQAWVKNNPGEQHPHVYAFRSFKAVMQLWRGIASNFKPIENNDTHRPFLRTVMTHTVRIMGGIDDLIYSWHDDVIHGNIFRVTGSLWGEFTGHRWIPLTKASTWRLALTFSLICVSTNGSVINLDVGETLSRPLWRHCKRRYKVPVNAGHNYTTDFQTIILCFRYFRQGK